MKFALCNPHFLAGPIIIKTSDGKTLKVNWDVGKPDQTIREMFDVSIEEDGDDSENTTPLSKPMVWNGSSWMEVNQVEPEFQVAIFESEAYKANWNQLDEVEKNDIEMPVDEIILFLYRGCKGYNPCNNLQIKSLVNLMVQSVALQIQGYPIEEIRKIFKVEDPKWTLEELKELQKIKIENARLKELLKIEDENARRKELEELQKIKDENARLMSQREPSQRG